MKVFRSSCAAFNLFDADQAEKVTTPADAMIECAPVPSDWRRTPSAVRLRCNAPVTQSFLGHSYYRRSFAVIDGLHLMIVRNVPANERPGLMRRRVKGNLYWKLK